MIELVVTNAVLGGILALLYCISNSADKILEQLKISNQLRREESEKSVDERIKVG